MPRELSMLRPDRLPAAVRFVAYGAAVAMLLYLTLAPGEALPSTNIWDKAQHARSWFLLTGLGLAFWPNRPVRVGGFALFLGAAVEVLQAILPFGRDGDVRDLLGDSVGIFAALVVWLALRRLAFHLIGEPERPLSQLR
jgi:VanZ family protein